MIPLKYTVEMEVPDDMMAHLKNNTVGLTVDDLVQTRIENALTPICKGAIIVYRTDEGKRPIDLYKTCPVCGHPWVRHFDQTKSEQAPMDDGGTGIRGVLIEPVATYCSECADQLPRGQFSCREALKDVDKKYASK